MPLKRSKKQESKTLDDIPQTDLPSWRRSQLFETAKTVIQIALMAVIAIALCVFLILMIFAGVTTLLPDTEGARALSKLFTEIAANAKTVVLFALGFFFREYLLTKGIGTK